jgi:hypothetical protein
LRGFLAKVVEPQDSRPPASSRWGGPPGPRPAPSPASSRMEAAACFARRAGPGGSARTGSRTWGPPHQSREIETQNRNAFTVSVRNSLILREEPTENRNALRFCAPRGGDHGGVFPCFLRGTVSTLSSSMRGARIMRGRVFVRLDRVIHLSAPGGHKRIGESLAELPGLPPPHGILVRGRGQLSPANNVNGTFGSHDGDLGSLRQLSWVPGATIPPACQWVARCQR